MIVDTLSSGKLHAMVTELYIGSRKINIALVFITQSYSAVQKKFRINCTHSFIMKAPNRRKLEQVITNHSY